MERVKSWFHQDKTVNQSPILKENLSQESDSNDERTHQLSESRNSANEPMNLTVDPRVAEYFKCFPEPYKTKAVNRFSSREGLYKWDLLRDYYMRRELRMAVKGTFLEDEREERRRVASLKETKHRQVEVMAPAQEETLDTEMPEWEKTLRTKIPVQKDDSLRWKLFQTANYSILGGVLFWTSVSIRRHKTGISKMKQCLNIGASLLVFGYFQMAAVYRLMDWGPFDKSVDDRDVFTKKFEEISTFWISLAETVRDGKDSSMERNNK